VPQHRLWLAERSRRRREKGNATARRLTVTAALVAALAFPAQASADHVACGDTITASTTLDADLVDCPGSGIIVGADNITRDLNRRTISGSDTTILGYPGIVLSGENATVRDGTVRGFNAGLEISGNDNLIRNCLPRTTTWVSASARAPDCAGTGPRAA